MQIECFNTPHGPKEPEHMHPVQANRFTMRASTLTFNIAGHERNAYAGEIIVVPPGVPHFFWNDDDAEAHYIQEFRPALCTEIFFETFFGLARGGD